MKAGQATQEALGIKKVIQNITGKRIGGVEVYCDNTLFLLEAQWGSLG
jgi:hypothetical protein